MTTTARRKQPHLTEQLRLQMFEDFRHDPQIIWTTDVAAAFLAVSPSALKKWRYTGEGPMYVRLSGTKVGYRREDLAAWVAARRAQSTSAEAAAASEGAPPPPDSGSAGETP